MKRLEKIIKHCLKLFLILFILIIGLLFLDFRSTEIYNVDNFLIPIQDKYFRVDNKEYNDSLLINFGLNKMLPDGYAGQTLIALSHFPELKEIKIEFKFKNIENSALMSRPTLSTVFFPWSNKEYIVLISNETNNLLLQKCLLKNLPYNAQIGVIAHELAHIIGYMNEKSYQLSFDYFKYEFSQAYFNELENITEKNVIKHGLGYQLLSWSEFQYHIKVKLGLGQAYLSPALIKTYISNDSIYQKY